MKKIVLLACMATTLLTGCASTIHRYEPDPFGHDTTYSIVYSESTPRQMYQCISTAVSRKGFTLEQGWPEVGEMENYFVTKHGQEVARYDFDGRNMAKSGLSSVSLWTPAGGESKLFNSVMKYCE